MTLNWKAQVVLVVIAAGVITGAVLWNNAHQREISALDAKLKAQQVASDSAAKAFGVTIDTLVGKVADFRAKAARVEAAKASSDIAVGHLRSARDSLAQSVADSMSTLQELRERAARLIMASDSAEKAHQREREAADSAIASAKRATIFAVDSVVDASKGALNAAIQRAVTAERLAHVQTGWRARLLRRCGLIGGYGGVLGRDGGQSGPAVIVGCRVAP